MDMDTKPNPQTKISTPELFVAEIDERSCAMQARKKFLDYLKKLEQCQKEGKGD